MRSAPLSGVSTLTSERPATPLTGSALHLAVSRSAAVRLAPVAAALAERGMLQLVLDPAGRAAPPRVDRPPDVLVDPAAAVEAAVEAALERARPAFALVAGDGNPAVTAALAAARHGVPIVRVGAGLRCNDRGVAGEINRLVLDELADRLYVDGATTADRLRAEGTGGGRIVATGSTLADSTRRWIAAASARAVWKDLRLSPHRYVLVTLHKPENVADDERVARITEALGELARRAPVVICLHPSIRAAMEPVGDLERLQEAGAHVTGPLPYVDFLSLQAGAGAVLTDSGGVQEETTMLGVACFTLADASERTLTLTHGTNVLLGDSPAGIAEVTIGAFPEPVEPIALWDGQAGRRIAADLATWSGS
jgi:UDP-N-acetylglucosamine 2-epimerase (non-hydrolysing)